MVDKNIVGLLLNDLFDDDCEMDQRLRKKQLNKDNFSELQQAVQNNNVAFSNSAALSDLSGTTKSSPAAAARSLKSRKVHARPKEYVEKTVPSYSGADYKSHFRLEKSTTEVLLHILKNEGLGSNETRHGAPKPVGLEKMTLITLWYLANQETMRSIADRFDVSQSTVHTSIRKVTSVLADASSKFISWPEQRDLPNIVRKFKERANLPGVVGAIDGSHIAIEAPLDHQDEYNNRKMTHSMILQCVCDSSKKFINCFAGFPGSCHDARVLRNSTLYRQTEVDPRVFFQSDSYHIVGDSAYPLLIWLLVPFKDMGNLTNVQTRFNKKLSQTRIIIECAFALLKGRFRRLKMVVAKLDAISSIITAACVLHNLCLDNNDSADDLIDLDDMLDAQELPCGNCASENDRAKQKRIYIANAL